VLRVRGRSGDDLVVPGPRPGEIGGGGVRVAGTGEEGEWGKMWTSVVLVPGRDRRQGRQPRGKNGNAWRRHEGRAEGGRGRPTE
jgi:hypothetical protein